MTDGGIGLLRLCAKEFWFTAEYVGLFLQLQRDSQSRVDVMTAMFPRIVDCANLQSRCFDYLTKVEMVRMFNLIFNLINLINLI